MLHIPCTLLLQERMYYSIHTCSNHSKRTYYIHSCKM